MSDHKERRLAAFIVASVGRLGRTGVKTTPFPTFARRLADWAEHRDHPIHYRVFGSGRFVIVVAFNRPNRRKP